MQRSLSSSAGGRSLSEHFEGAHLFAENMQSAERANERQVQTAERLF